MKRWLVRIFVFLILGAIVNVAVAWALVWSRGVGDNRFDGVFGDVAAGRVRHYWDLYRPSDFAPKVTDGVVYADCLGFDYCFLEIQNVDSRRENAVVMTAGLPVQAMVGYRFERLTWDMTTNTRGWVEHANMFWMVDNGFEKGTWLWLPLRPIWPGFAINTMFYAAILWLLFAAPFALRRRRRIKRGLCPKCAYPIGTSDNCTECGTGVIG